MRAHVTLGYGEVEVDHNRVGGRDRRPQTFEASRVREIAVVGVY